MSDEIADRLLARVRRQFRCHEIEFAGWRTTNLPSRVGMFRVPDPVVASRMRDRGFRVVGRYPEVLAGSDADLDLPTDDRGIEMFERFCWLVLVLLAVAVTAWLVFGKGGVR